MSEENTDNALVSVIIPTYNRAHLVTEALDSVCEQTYRPIECIVVDDGSTDDTVEVVKKWKRAHTGDDFCVRLLRQENQGAPAARNHGMEAAQGKYLLFLDSDDQLPDDAIEVLYQSATETNAGAAYGDLLMVSENGKRERRDQEPPSSSDVVNMMRRLPRTSSVMICRKAIQEVRWRQDMSCAQELAFFLDLSLQGVEFQYVDEVVSHLLQHDGCNRISNRQDRGDLVDAISYYLLKVEKNFRRQEKKENKMYDQTLIRYGGLLSSYGKHRFAHRLMKRASRLRVLGAILRDARFSLDVLVPLFFGAKVAGLAYQIRRFWGGVDMC